MTLTDLNAQLASYLAFQADSIEEGDLESAEALGEAIDKVCALIDAAQAA